MPWHEPQSMEEYTARMEALIKSGQMASGFGNMTAQHMPCPWCAAPDFAVVMIIHAERELAAENTCEKCGRAGKNLVIYLEGGGTTSEFVQTDGPDAPDWLQPHPRRLRKDGLLESLTNRCVRCGIDREHAEHIDCFPPVEEDAPDLGHVFEEVRFEHTKP